MERPSVGLVLVLLGVGALFGASKLNQKIDSVENSISLPTRTMALEAVDHKTMLKLGKVSLYDVATNSDALSNPRIKKYRALISQDGVASAVETLEGNETIEMYRDFLLILGAITAGYPIANSLPSFFYKRRELPVQ